jgi:hypothetical protein
MAQLFDPTALSLSGAADMVAIRVTLGVAANPVMTKEAGIVEDLLAKVKGMDNPLANFDISNPAHAAMLGGGVGMGGGLLATIMSKRKKKRWLRNALLGGALGAGIGGAGSYMAKHGPGILDTEATDLVKEYKEGEVNLGKMRSGETPATPEQLEALKAKQVERYRVIEASGADPSIESPLPPTSPDAVARMGSLGLTLGEGNVGDTAKNVAGWGAHDVVNRPANTAAATLAGGAAGTGVDWLRAKRYARSQAARHEAKMTAPVTANEIRDAGVQKGLPKKLKAQIGAKLDAPKPQARPGKPAGPITPAASLLGPSAASMAMPVPRPPAPITGNKDIISGVNLRKSMHQLQANAEQSRRATAAAEQAAKPTTQQGWFGRTRPIKPPGPRMRHAGKAMGTLGGLGASLFTDWGVNPAEEARR